MVSYSMLSGFTLSEYWWDDGLYENNRGAKNHNYTKQGLKSSAKWASDVIVLFYDTGPRFYIGAKEYRKDAWLEYAKVHVSEEKHQQILAAYGDKDD